MVYFGIAYEMTTLHTGSFLFEARDLPGLKTAEINLVG